MIAFWLYSYTGWGDTYSLGYRNALSLTAPRRQKSSQCHLAHLLILRLPLAPVLLVVEVAHPKLLCRLCLLDVSKQLLPAHLLCLRAHISKL